MQTDPSSLPSRPQNMSNLVWACATVMYKDEARGEEEVFQWLFHSGGWFFLKVAIHQGTEPQVVKAMPDLLVICWVICYLSCWIMLYPDGVPIDIPAVFRAEAAMRTVASSAALRVAEFGTQDHVVFSVGFCPFWCPLNKLTYIDVENPWKPPICRFFSWGNYGFSTFML